MTFEITGEYNTATVHTTQSKDDAEDKAVEQIQEMVDHKAFVGDDDIAIAPDYHWGAGAVIGFTMPVKDRVVPNTIGKDIGCGMYAVRLDVPEFDTTDTELLSKIDTEIRNRVPIGFGVVHDRNDYHMLNDFPWLDCETKWDRFAEATDFDLPQDEIPKYPHSGDDTYFENVCQRVGYDQGRAINSLGSNGGGNHFIELGTDSHDNVWCIIHSGSRGIGAAIAEYWQDVATEKTYQRDNLVKIPEEEAKYFEFDEALIDRTDDGDGGHYTKPESLEIDREAILDDYEGEAIEGKFGQLRAYLQAGKSDASPLDYLEGEEAHGYIKDMIFAQTYASESRKQMAKAVDRAFADVLGLDTEHAVFLQEIESVHNYIDFEDGTIRKGACRAHDGEDVIIPFNMQYGTLIARGNGHSDWNNSAPHGAGRAMSRTAAKDRFDDDDFDEQIGDVFMSKQPLDEIPGAYKNPGAIESAIGDSVDIVDRIEPFMSIKAE